MKISGENYENPICYLGNRLSIFTLTDVESVSPLSLRIWLLILNPGGHLRNSRGYFRTVLPDTFYHSCSIWFYLIGSFPTTNRLFINLNTIMLIISRCWLYNLEIYANTLICRGTLLGPSSVQVWKLSVGCVISVGPVCTSEWIRVTPTRRILFKFRTFTNICGHT